MISSVGLPAANALFRNCISALISIDKSFMLFTAYSQGDTRGELFDASGKSLQSDDDGGSNNNFRITYYLEAGKTYTIVIWWYSGENEGDMPLFFFCE